MSEEKNKEPKKSSSSKWNKPIWWQGFSDLRERYGNAFREAWRYRKETDNVSRLPHEAQFLPAALSLQETPVSPAPRIAMWLLISFAVIALLWTLIGHIDVVAVAQGKVVPNERVKTIQSMETASVKAIHVTDGQVVKAGDLLIELDATVAKADIDRVRNEWVMAKLQAERARALLNSIQTQRMPTITDAHASIMQMLKKQVHGEHELQSVEAKISEAQHQVEGQFAEYQAKLARIHANIARSEAELRSTHSHVEKLEKSVTLTRSRARDYKSLLDEEFVAKHAYLEKEQQLIEQEGDLNTQRSRVKEIEAALREARGQQMSLVTETRRFALDSLAEGDQKATTLYQELIKADSRGKLMQLTAPVDGVVQQLAIHTVGGVVTPAQALMIVVPKDHPLEVEAFLENKDIGFVNDGQRAEVKIETFSYVKYGTIPATVQHVSMDAINDEKRGLIYSTRIKLDKTAMNIDGKMIPLSPGMAVTVEIKTKKRRVISYFLSPLLQYQKESLRER